MPMHARRRPDRPIATVLFDCDSTLSTLEGIEELAAEHRAEVVALTEAAMRGAVPLEQVYARRLALVRPTLGAVEAIGRRYVETLVEDAREVVAALAAEGVSVRIISGGVRQAVLVLGRALGLPDSHVAAVDLRFDAAGRYAGFDAASPLARSGGKAAAIDAWLPAVARPAMLVGDGAADLEAAAAVDLFVAYAGVVPRPAVLAGADAVIASRSLAPVLPLALAAPPRDPRYRDLWQKGVELIG
jgi:phosphoserine phosphatase